MNLGLQGDRPLLLSPPLMWMNIVLFWVGLACWPIFCVRVFNTFFRCLKYLNRTYSLTRSKKEFSSHTRTYIRTYKYLIVVYEGNYFLSGGKNSGSSCVLSKEYVCQCVTPKFKVLEISCAVGPSVL